MNPMLQEYLDEVTARRARELEKLKKENTLLRAQYAYANFLEGHPLPPLTHFNSRTFDNRYARRN